jgi:hypothetical protein
MSRPAALVADHVRHKALISDCPFTSTWDYELLQSLEATADTPNVANLIRLLLH